MYIRIFFILQHWLDLAKTAIKQVKGWYHLELNKRYLSLIYRSLNKVKLSFSLCFDKEVLKTHFSLFVIFSYQKDANVLPRRRAARLNCNSHLIRGYVTQLITQRM